MSDQINDVSVIEHHNMLEKKARDIIQDPDKYPDSTVALARIVVKSFDGLRERGERHPLMM